VTQDRPISELLCNFVSRREIDMAWVGMRAPQLLFLSSPEMCRLILSKFSWEGFALML
jgi:hypothetical protein